MRFSVFWTYATALSITALSVLGLASALDYFFGRQVAMAYAAQLQHAEARAAKFRLQGEIRSIEVGLTELAGLPWLANCVPEKDCILEFQRLLKLTPSILEIRWSRPDAALDVVATRTGLDGFSKKIAGTDQLISKGSVPVFSAVQHEPGGKTVTASIDVGDNGAARLHAKLDLRFAANWVRQSRFKNSGTISLVDPRGQIIAHPDSRFYLRNTNIFDEWRARGWDRVPADSEQLPFVSGVSPENTRVMSSAVLIPQTQWWVVAELTESEALQDVRNQLIRNLLTLCVGAIAAFGLAYFFSRKLSTPIVAMSAAANRFAKGNLNERIDIARSDEIGNLAADFNHMATELQALTQNLEEQVNVKTAQLETEFTKREAQTKEITKLEERARIMRDIHDGVGGHLVGLLGAAKREQLEPKAVEAMVQDALVDFRIAIDSLSPNETDVTTALASLKFRMQPRIQSAGLEAKWNLEDVPASVALSRETLFHLQRIVAEAITNAVKHAAGATMVSVNLRWNAAQHRIELDVADDGVGVARRGISGEPAGRGLENMRTRAKAIGGHIEVTGLSAERGTLVRLLLPIE